MNNTEVTARRWARADWCNWRGHRWARFIEYGPHITKAGEIARIEFTLYPDVTATVCVPVSELEPLSDTQQAAWTSEVQAHITSQPIPAPPRPRW